MTDSITDANDQASRLKEEPMLFAQFNIPNLQGLQGLHLGVLQGVIGGVGRRTVTDDAIDVVVHVFSPETRKFYGLESLWKDAESLAVSQFLKREETVSSDA